MSGEPVRLLDEGGLPFGERALLDARADGAPFGYDVDRGASRFKASLVALTAAGALSSVHGVTRATSALGGKGMLLNVVVKVVVGLAAGAGLFTGGVVLGTHLATRATPGAPAAPLATAPLPPVAPPRRPASDGAVAGVPRLDASGQPGDGPRLVASTSGVVTDRPGEGSSAGLVRRAPSVDRGATGSPHTQSVSARSLDSPLATSPAVAPAPTAVASSSVAAAPQPAVAAEPPSTAAPQIDSLSELRALAVARNLVDRDPDAALVALDKMRRDYPKGYFVEERQALTVLALAGAGRTSAARQQAGAFLRSFPNGPFSERVRAVLRSTD